MANNDATVIVGKLSDKELQDSINKLVAHVETASKKMADSFDAQIQRMKQSLNGLGNVNINFGGSKSAGEDRVSTRLKKVDQQAKETTVTFDKLAEATQKAANPARDSYYAMFKGFKEQAQYLQQLINSWENLSLNRRIGDFNAVGNEIDKAKQKISELKEEITQLRRSQPDGYRGMILIKELDIAKLKDRIAELRVEQQKIADAPIPESPYVEKLRARYNAVKQILNEHFDTQTKMIKKAADATVSASNKEDDATRKRIQTEQEYARKTEQNEEARRQAMKQTGAEAQRIAKEVIQRMYSDLQSSGTGPIMGIKELEQAVIQMRRAWFTMDATEQESAIGRALIRDIAVTQKAIKAIQDYNKEVSGVRPIGGDSAERSIRSYERLSNLVKELRDEFNRLSQDERNSAKGTEIIDKLQRFGAEIKDIQRQMNRPTSLKKALGMDESTLDHINDKLQALRAYKSGLKITDEKQLEEMRRVDQEINRLQRDYDKLMQKNQEMIASNTALGRSWNYMKNRLAFYFSVGASTQFIKSLIEVRSQYEMNERALGILINSAERGTEIFQQLSQMALVSPYTLIELSSAAKQLTAYDIAAKDVVDTTRRLADMASAVGVPMERLTYALGQIKAYGYLNSRDARMFANAGIPLVKQLSEYYTQLEGRMVSVGDVYDRMKKKAIDFNSVMAVVNKMTDEGGKFFDFQAKMADTLKVRMANLTLAWNNMLNDIGAQQQGVLTTGIDLLKKLFLHWKDINDAFTNVAWVVGVRTAIALLSFAVNRLGLAFGATWSKMALAEVFGARLAKVITTITRAFWGLISSPITWLVLAGMAVYDIAKAFSDANEAQEQFNKALREGSKKNYDDITRFLEQYEELRKRLYKESEVVIGKVYDPQTGNAEKIMGQGMVAVDLDKNEAKKTWDVISEQIEVSTKNADDYISRLMTIENVSERVRQGFDLLEEIREVSAAMKDLDDDTIKINQDTEVLFINIKDGLITNLKDLVEQINKVNEKYGTLADAKALANGANEAYGYVNDYRDALDRFKEDLETTTQSIINFIELKGWSGDTTKINEVFKQITDKIILENQLDPKNAFILQQQVEESRAAAAKESLVKRINDEKAAYAIAQDEMAKEAIDTRLKELEEEYKLFDQFNGKNRVYWQDFTKWLKEQHNSEMREMFRGMNAEQIKSLDFQSGKYNDWINRMVSKYAKEHKLSYDEAFGYLKNWVTNANQWSIFIPLTISTEGEKTALKTLEEADAAYDAAEKAIKRLEKRKKELVDTGASATKAVADQTKADKELVKVETELTEQQIALADARSKGGHGKKEESEARKEQKAAESELQRALKEEISLVNQVRSAYDTLSKGGMNHLDAITSSTRGFDETVDSINQSLSKFGLQKLDLSKFVGSTNPRMLVEMFEKQLNVLLNSPYVKPAEIKDLQVEIQKLKLKVDEFDQKTITDSLNSELSKLKDEYELAVALDADPELGNMFADMMGINVETLPRTVKEYADEYTKLLNKYLGEKKAGIELPHLHLTNDDLAAFQQMVKEGKLTEEAFKFISDAVLDVNEKTRKDITDTEKAWNDILKKYAEYEYKLNSVLNTTTKEYKDFIFKFGSEGDKTKIIDLQTDILATHDPTAKQELINKCEQLAKDVAGDDKTKITFVTAISNKGLQESARVTFEEFQKSPEWVTATGDLAGLSNTALTSLIAKIEQYKKSARDLSPKQIKQINSALRNLHRQVRKGNPFEVLANASDEAKDRFDLYQDAIDQTQKELNELSYEMVNNGDTSKETTDKINKLIERIKELKKAQDEASEIDTDTMVQYLSNVISLAKQATGIFTDMIDALGGEEATKDINAVFGVLDKMMAGALIGASFGGYGAAIGGIVGMLSGVIGEISDILSGNKAITEAVEHSTLKVKGLELAYIDLEEAINKAYGAAAVGAKKAAVYNKELQLIELKRQLELEQSRSSKDKDTDRIVELQKQIKELEYDIVNSIDDITNELLGISSVGDAAETMVSSMIDAFRKGEDYMATFSESFDDMIDNMVMKTIVSKVIGERIQELFDYIQSAATQRAGAEESAYKQAVQEYENWLKEMAITNPDKTTLYSFDPYAATVVGDRNKVITKDEQEKLWKERVEYFRKRFEEASTPTPDDVKAIGDLRDSWYNGVKTEFEAWMSAFGIGFGQDNATQLSALQQGIQGITENTAGALEAYMNGVSQQVYLQSEYLRQICEVMTVDEDPMDDVKVASLSQILLQLRSSYEVQNAIHSLLNGWSSDNMRSIRVEMV